MNETRPALLPTCSPTESVYSQPESQSSCRLLLQFRYSSSEVWKCLKQSQQFSDPLQYQTLQLCVIAAMLKWGQLLQALTTFPFSLPLVFRLFSQHLLRAVVSLFPLVVLLLHLCYSKSSSLWIPVGKIKGLKRKKCNGMKIQEVLVLHRCFNRFLSKKPSIKTLGIWPKYNKHTHIKISTNKHMPE